MSSYTAAVDNPSFSFWNGVIKIMLIAVLAFSSFYGVFLLGRRYIPTFSSPDEKVLLSGKYKQVLWRNFGKVFEPILKVPLYYPDYGFVEKEFLVDSGAVVSSLPREEAEIREIELAKLKRTTFAGYGGGTSFAYQSDAKIKVGQEEVTIPVVYTEARGTKFILGRSGFFDKYSLFFNRTAGRVEVRK